MTTTTLAAMGAVGAMGRRTSVPSPRRCAVARSTRGGRVAASASMEEKGAKRGNATSRRGVLGSSLAFVVLGGSSSAALAKEVSTPLGEPLKPLAEYRAALDRVRLELDAIAADLRTAAGLTAVDNDNAEAKEGTTAEESSSLLVAAEAAFDEFDEQPPAVPLTARERQAFKARLHDGELGFFWVTSRGTDRYMMGQRSPFARDREVGGPCTSCIQCTHIAMASKAPRGFTP
jgi:hypothetical protein